MPVFANQRASVIGSGPNGLAAANLLAEAGLRVTVFEGASAMGGGARSGELTIPGFVHDICSAVLPMAAASPCFQRLALEQHGLEWIHSPAALAHPMDDGSAVMLERSLAATARGLGADGAAWAELMGPLAAAWPDLRHDVLGPLGVPRDPLGMARFGLLAVRRARGLAEERFRGERARALFAGIAAHSAMPLEAPLSAAIGLALAVCAHTVGWPFPRGGTQRISEALAGCLRSQGGEILTGTKVDALPEDGSLVLAAVTPRQMLRLAGERFPGEFRRLLERYRYGPGAYKLDWALDAPIPWRAEECARAGTVHLGGTLEEIAQWESTHTGRPFVLLTQLSLFDETRAPAGRHTAWAYCHVPNGSTGDYTEAIEEQVERFAPGFRSRILARRVHTPADLERYNPNLIGGDFSGGAQTPWQMFARPTRYLYRTPLPEVFFCGSSTPPGAGVHGMCGFHAARTALSTFLPSSR